MPRRQRTTRALLACAVSLLLAACSVADAEPGSGEVGPGVAAATLSVMPSEVRTWHPDRPVIVSVTDGTLTSVSVVDARGRSVGGRLTADATIWRSRPPMLRFDTRYRVRAVATDVEGRQTKVETWFRTEKPKSLVHASVTPSQGQVVGVGMPIVVTFDAPVPKREVVERRLSVTTVPATQGAWYWVSDQMVRWRPREYWQPGTRVSVDSRLDGIHLGQGVWGDDDDRVRFAIGDAVISTVDIAAHTMTVTRNGVVIRKLPITTGKPGWDTRNGIKVIISKQREMVMDAATLEVSESDPEYYRLEVEYAMRITWSGEFLHAAPWSVADHGKNNVSHGCTGLSLERASWLYNLSKPGDVVQYVNGVRSMEPWNGYTDWNMSWSQWRQGSAVG